MKSFFAALLGFFVFAAPLFADTFRCRNVVFTEGDTRAEVLLKCGEPDYEEVVRKTEKGESDREEGVFSRDTEYVVEWYYDCGRRQFVRIITFKGGKILSVGDLDTKGTGDNPRDCR
jgi:hypothetical protein